MNKQKHKVILAVCSSGGHLVQMESILSSLDLNNVVLACCDSKSGIIKAKQILIPDCNFSQPVKILICTLFILKIIIKERPCLILSTGAAPGGLAIFLGSILKIKSIWIDSIANAERPSLTGRLVKPFATSWISQWEIVAKNIGGKFYGKIFSIFERGNSTSI